MKSMDLTTEKSINPGLADVPVSARKSSDGSSREAKKLCAGREVRPTWFKWREGRLWFRWPRGWVPPPGVRSSILVAYAKGSTESK